MAEITAAMVKTLRERTGVGMSKCKKALDEAAGDIEKAIDILRKAGAASAVKKSERATNEGLIAYHEGIETISLVEVNAETDFVVKNEKFREFVDHLAELSAKEKPSSVEDLSALKLNGETVEEVRASLIQSIGENIVIKRVKTFEKKTDTSYGLYKHMTGKIVTFVEITGSNKAEVIARDVAMHVAADAPEYLTADDVPSEIIEKEKEIARTQLQNKPAEMMDKILVGKVKSFCDQVCLVGQKFVKDPSMTVEKYVQSQGKSLGADLKISQFLRWEVGGQ